MIKLFAGIIAFITSLFAVNTVPSVFPTPTPDINITQTITGSPSLTQPLVPTRRPTPSIVSATNTPIPTQNQVFDPSLARPLLQDNSDKTAPKIAFAGPGQETLNEQTGHICYGITASDSVSPKEKILYRYRMDSSSLSEWLNWDIISQGICFNNLSPGNHIFYLEAKDEAGNIGYNSLNQEIHAIQQIY